MIAFVRDCSTGTGTGTCACPGNTVNDGTGTGTCTCPGNTVDDGTGTGTCVVCADEKSAKFCKKQDKKGNCEKSKIYKVCMETCGKC